MSFLINPDTGVCSDGYSCSIQDAWYNDRFDSDCGLINPRRYDGVLGLSVGGHSAQTPPSPHDHHPVYNGRCMRGGSCFVGGACYF